MMRNTKLWLWIAGIFVVINVGGGVYAAALGEGNHAGVHVLLTVIGVYGFRRLKERGEAAAAEPAEAADRRLDELQRSVDAVAIEVERIGEAQRYQTKLAAERPPRASR
jgi:hypothetical protein